MFADRTIIKPPSITLESFGLKHDDTQFYNPIPLDHTLCFHKLAHALKRNRFDNISAAIQAFTEEIVLRWIRGGVKKYGIPNILCSGGVFMNVKLNKLIAELPEAHHVDVFPSCGDESNIFGAAWHLENRLGRTGVGWLQRYTLGTSPNDLEATLDRYGESIIAEHLDDPKSKYS